MMDWSDHHCRYFWRLLTRQGPAVHGDGHHRRADSRRPRALPAHFNPRGAPGGPVTGRQRAGADLAGCARPVDCLRRGQSLNCGCPSDPGCNPDVRRLPDGAAGAGGRLRQGPCALPATSRLPSSTASASITWNPTRVAGFRGHRGGSRLRGVHRPRSQGLAAGAVPKENRDIPPLKLPLGVPPQTRPAAAVHRHQWRHPDPGGVSPSPATGRRG